MRQNWTRSSTITNLICFLIFCFLLYWNVKEKLSFLILMKNKLGYFYVTAWSIVEKGYNKNFAAQLLEKWLRYWQWPTKLAIEVPSWCLKFFVVLTLLLPTGVLPKKNSAQMVEKWLKYWQWPTKLAIEAPTWSLKFFVVLTLLLPTGGLPKKISAQSVEKWLRYWQLKVCGGVVVVGWVPVHRLVTATVRFGCDNLLVSILSTHYVLHNIYSKKPKWKDNRERLAWRASVLTVACLWW